MPDSTDTSTISVECLFPRDYNLQVPANPLHKNVELLFWLPVREMSFQTNWRPADADYSTKERERWVLYSTQPVFVRVAFQRAAIRLNPGDSVVVDYRSGSPVFTGKGAASVQLQYDLEAVNNTIVKPTPFPNKINGVVDYLGWSRYLNKRLDTTLRVLEAANALVPDSVLNALKASAFYRAENDRTEAFMSLNNYRGKTAGLSKADLVRIADSTLDTPASQWLRNCTDCAVPTWYFYQYNRIMLWKTNAFDNSNDSMNTDGKRRIVYYSSLKENYTGLLRERLLQYLLGDECIKELGIDDPVTDSLLTDYYREPGFPEYKAWMKNYADSMRVVHQEKLAKKKST